MVLNTTMTSNISTNSMAENKKGQTNQLLMVSTADFKDQDLEDFVNISEEIVRTTRERRWLRKRARSRSNIIAATMTREEIFETTNMDDDDQYLKAMEHETTYDAEKTERSALANSWENLMKYFDEEVKVRDESWDKVNANKKSAKGKVASALTSLRNKCSLMTTPLGKNKTSAKTVKATNIQELKKKYESSMEGEITPSPKAFKLSKSPKLTRKTKVKQMTSLFNNKINSMKKNSTLSPATVKSESVTPAASHVISPPTYTPTLKNKSPKVKAKLASFKTKLPSPKPSPFFKRKPQPKTSSNSSLAYSPELKRKQLKEQTSTTCLQAENAFSQLSVKDKVLLYNKFVEDMSKQNPKFSKHAEVLESKVKKEIQKGEVVIERQNSVRYLRDSLEAKLTPAKSFIKSPQRCGELSFKTPLNTNYKAKEYEDLSSSPGQDDNQDPLHLSSLTVVLKTTPDAKNCLAKFKTQRKKKDVKFLEDVCYIEPRVKRTQSMMRPSFLTESLAPPKKIRRFRHEQLAPNMFFQDPHLEKLFYHWLKEKNGIAFDITTADNKNNIIEIVAKEQNMPPQQVQEILEAAINNTELAHKEHKAIDLIKNTLENEKALEKSVIEVELPMENVQQVDKDFGLTSTAKTSSEDSQMETNSPDLSTASDKPLRKKKLRRSVSLKKDEPIANELKISSTDSDSDCKIIKSTNFIKNLILKPIKTDITVSELDVSLIRQVNSPSKIKSVYTLTAMSSPSPFSEAEFNESEIPKTPNKEMSRSWPSLWDNDFGGNDNSLEFSNLSHSKWQQGQLILESLIDQGFETGSNERNSPVRLNRKADNPENFSTPYKSNKHQRQAFTGQADLEQYNTLSPIKTNCTPRVRCNLTVTIEADQQRTQTPSSLNETTCSSSETSLTHTNNYATTTPTQNKNTSEFWITSGYFTAGISIYHYESEHLMLFSNIFSQKSLQWKEMNFGIDDQKFSMDSLPALDRSIQQVTTEENCSHYWFSTGDFLVPFKGPQMNTKKIQTFLNYIREFMNESNYLRFGIDGYEFSNIYQQTDYPITPISDIPWTQMTSSPLKTSDLDHSEDEDDSRGFIQSPHFSSASLNSDNFFGSSRLNLKNQPSTSLTSQAQHFFQGKQQTVKQAKEMEMLNSQEKVKLFGQGYKSYEQSSGPIKINIIQESVGYISKIRSIIEAIENIGLEDKLKT